jgi:hypothetical protein
MVLAMDETRRAALEAELRDALREREQLTQRLNHVIAYLSARLGIPEPANDRFGIPVVGTGQPAPPPQAKPPAPSTSPPPRPAPPTPAAQGQPLVERPDPEELVREGEFSSLSRTEAAVAVLRRVGSPLTTAELYSAVVKGGVKVKDRGALYRSMYRVERITRVGTALWGLTEWSPQNGHRAQNADPAKETTESDKDATVPEHGERLDGVVA